jgi:hypothetical protein
MNEGVAATEQTTWTLISDGEYWEVPPCRSCGEQLWIVEPYSDKPAPAGQHIAELTCSVCAAKETALLLMQS